MIANIKPGYIDILWGITKNCSIDTLRQPLQWGKPCLVSVGSDCDLFDGSVPEGFIDQVFSVMALADRHRFKVLTRFPDNMRRYLTSDLRHERIGLCNTGLVTPDWIQEHWPLSNVWLGVNIEDQKSADERIPTLLKTPAALRWASAEPLMGAVDIVPYLGGRSILCGCGFNYDETFLIGATVEYEGCLVCNKRTQSFPTLDWVVAGGASGEHASPVHPHWLEFLVAQCSINETPFLFTQWGDWAGHYYPAEGVKHVELNGRFVDGPTPTSYSMKKVGKKAAGRAIREVVYNGYPQHA